MFGNVSPTVVATAPRGNVPARSRPLSRLRQVVGKEHGARNAVVLCRSLREELAAGRLLEVRLDDGQSAIGEVLQLAAAEQVRLSKSHVAT